MPFDSKPSSLPFMQVDKRFHLGEKDLDVCPVRLSRARFEHDGKTEVGHIEQIDPPDWESNGAVPKVLVVQRQ